MGVGKERSSELLQCAQFWGAVASPSDGSEALGSHGLRREYVPPFLCMVAELCALFCGVPRCLRIQHIFPLQYDYQNFVLIPVFLISFY